MDWQEFVEGCYNTLKFVALHVATEESFNKEQDLTRYIVLALRRTYAEYFGLSPKDKLLHNRIIFRQGDSDADKIAWKKAKDSKWIMYHGVRFVPDILIFHDDNVLPFEIKLIKRPGSAQAIATSIGQAIIYSSTYPDVIIFIGIKRSIKWGRYELKPTKSKTDRLIHQRLLNNNVRLIMREVD